MNTMARAKPFLRWAGGKSWLLKTLEGILPPQFNAYHEPFLGGGSVFFFLNPSGRAYLSDINAQLINAYVQIRDNVEDVLKIMRGWQNTPQCYYRIRGTHFPDPLHQAAQFIYLNRTGFNGIYRVNLRGQYNVPFGRKKYKILFDPAVYRSASKCLQNTMITCADFYESEAKIAEGDLVFLDPPYKIRGPNNGFIKYNDKLFSWSDQLRLASYIESIQRKGAFYILTNAKHPDIHRLFGRINKPITVRRHSVVGGRMARRRPIEEYLFSNLIP